MKTSFLAFYLNVFLCLAATASSHSWITSPRHYDRRALKARTCKQKSRSQNVRHPYSLPSPRCTWACPLFRPLSSVSPNHPAAVWKRGERISAVWTKNNHHGGFVRLSLVPLSAIHDPRAHSRLTLLHTCWESGEHHCRPGQDCGTDKSGEAFQKFLRIPSVFPDGLYVFGYVWYGGLNFTRKFGQFPDYHSCSIVRIEGGDDLKGTYAPYFDAGLGRRIVNGMCQSSATRVGECIDGGCDRRGSFYAVPALFSNGRAPSPFTQEDVIRIAKGSEIHSKEPISVSPFPSERPFPSPVSSPSSSPFVSGIPSPHYTVSPPPSKGESKDVPDLNWEEKARMHGICKGNVCCPKKCLACGGLGCRKRPGGGNACCITRIREHGRSCFWNSPPCVLP